MTEKYSVAEKKLFSFLAAVAVIAIIGFSVLSTSKPPSTKPLEAPPPSATDQAITQQIRQSADLRLEEPAGSQLSAYRNSFNTFTEPGLVVDRESVGEGALAADVRVEAPFYPQYTARSVIWPDGTHAIRMPTQQEAPGGYDYSTLYATVNFYGVFPTLSRVIYSWKIKLPKYLDYNSSNYNGHGWLFRSQTIAKEIFSVRFLSGRTIGFFLDDQLLSERLNFDAPFPGDSIHDLSVDLEHRPGGKIIFHFDDRTAEIRFSERYESPTREWVASAGNALRSDNDLNYFSSLGPVQGLAVSRSPLTSSTNRYFP